MYYLIKEYEIFKFMIHIVNYFPEKLNQFTLQKTKEHSFANGRILKNTQAASSISHL